MNDSNSKEKIKDRNNEKELTSFIVNESLQKVVKGTGILLVGTIIGMLLVFVNKILLARFFSQDEYGIFSLVFIIFNIFVIISTLGFMEGAPRQIAYYRAKKDAKKVRGVIISSIEMALISSIFFSLILFFTSEIISKVIFHNPELSSTLKIISIAIPFYVLINIFISIFGGFKAVKPKVYFRDLLINILFILFISIAIILHLPFLEVMYVFLFSGIVSCAVFTGYIIKKNHTILKKEKLFSCYSIKKDLLLFSFPLLITTMFSMAMTWTDTLMLGYYKTSDIVGLYNGAVPLARLIPIILTSVAFIYVPVISELFSKNFKVEIAKTYQVLTKWIFIFSIPVFSIIFLFPETVLAFFFGANYVPASMSLKVLCLGFMFHTFLGLNGLTLMVLGQTRFLMLTAIFGAISNLVLNAALIPYWGIVGAAIASFISYCVVNIFRSIKLYRLSKIHPFTRNYVKPLGISIILLTLFYASAFFLKIEFWMLPILLLLFVFAYGFLLLLTKSFDREDIDMLITIERRVKVDAGPIKKVLKRFL